jgi:DNA-binding CsgD family transcriptional regulator
MNCGQMAKVSNDTSALEREIDVLVYGLYGLSEEEIKIIEGEK